MIVLGFDTATPSSAVALRLADGSLAELRDDPAPGEHPGHATRLLTLARELLAGAGVAWGQLERIAVGVGPGTFTGLRVGVATARGLAQSLSGELVGVSSLAALAAPTLEDERQALAVIDARRGEVFAAAFERGGRGAPPRLTAAPRAIAPERFGELVGHRRGGGAPPAVGDGALRYRAQLEAAGVAVADRASPRHRVSAAAICALGALAPAASRYEDVLPDYLRRPDAELALEGAAAGAPR